MKTEFVISFWGDWNLVGFTVMLAVGVFVLPIMVMQGWKKRRGIKTPETMVGIALPLLALPVWITVSTLASFSYVSLSRALLADYEAGHYRVVEGPVKVLYQQPWGRHAAGDIVEIAGEQFEIHHFHMIPGYTDTISHGGVIREGNRVRLFVRGSYILRVEYEPYQMPEPTAASKLGS